MNKRLETAHDRMIRAEHRDPRRDEDESGNHRQQTADYAQDQKGDADHRSDNVPQVSW